MRVHLFMRKLQVKNLQGWQDSHASFLPIFPFSIVAGTEAIKDFPKNLRFLTISSDSVGSILRLD